MVMKILNKKNSICLVLLSGCFLVGCSDNSEKAHLDSQEEELTEDAQITIGNFEQEQLNSLEVPDVSFEENPSYIAPNVSFEQDEYDEIPLISFEGEVSSDDKADEYNDALNGYRESVSSGKKMSLKDMITLFEISNEMRENNERIEEMRERADNK